MNLRLKNCLFPKLAWGFLLFIAALLYSQNSLASDKTPPSFEFGAPGTIDFLQYWSAYQLYSNSENHYDLKALSEIQSTIGNQGVVIANWNPPWLLNLMAPILIFDFQTSAFLWFLLSTLFWFITCILLFKTYPPGNTKFIFSFLALVLFYPVYETLLWGQISILLLLIFALFLHELKKENYFLSGLILSLSTIKPHLFLLVYLISIIWSFKEKRASLLQGLTLGITFLILSVSLFNYSSLEFWVYQILNPQTSELSPSIHQWKSASITAFIRGLFSSNDSSPLTYLAIVIPLVFYVYGMLYWKNNLSGKLNIETVPYILCFSNISQSLHLAL